MSNAFDRITSGSPARLEQPESKSQAADVNQSQKADDTSLEVKELTQELLKHGYIEEAAKPV